jgi:hypothetical protein
MLSNAALQFSSPDLISLDDYVFNTEAHPFRVPKPHPSPAPSMWSGPEPDAVPVNSFVSTMGEGTHVQLWTRVHQAAHFIRIENAASNGGAPVPQDNPVARPVFVPPSAEELEETRAKQRQALQEAKEGLRAAAKDRFEKEKLAQDAVRQVDPNAGAGRGFGRPG